MDNRLRRWVMSPLICLLLLGACSSTGGESDGADGLRSEPLPQAADGLPPDHRQLALIADLHGPTDDVSAEMARLVPFPELPTPVGARIIELDVIAPRQGRVDRLRAKTSFLADGPPADLVLFYETSFAATGWDLIEQRRGQTIEDFASTEFIYEQPSANEKSMADELEVTVIDDTDLGQTRIDVVFKIDKFSPEESGYAVGSAAYFQPWFADWHDAPIPAGWQAASATQVNTFFGEGRSVIRLTRLVRYDDPPFNGIDDFQQLILAEAKKAGLPARISRTIGQTDGIEVDHPDFEPLYLVLDERFDNTIRVAGEARFATPPFAPVSSEDADQAIDPLPSNASIAQIETVINDMHGPSNDVSAQMRRLGPFPDLRTPNGATIVRLEAGVIPANQSRFNRLPRAVDPEGRAAAVAGVELVVNGTVEDVETFYLTAIQGRPWVGVREEIESDDGELSNRRRYDYDIADAGGGKGEGNQAQFVLEINDDIDFARVMVSLQYVEFVPLESSGIERFSSWMGNAPIPEGGRLDQATVITEEIWSTTNLEVSYSFENETNEALHEAIGPLIADSDYSLDPDLNVLATSYPLVHPNLSRASVGLDSVTYVGELADQVSPEIKDRLGVRLNGTAPLRPGESATSAPDDASGTDERTITDVADGLAPLAPLDEMLATLTDVHGTTDDVSGQVLRIARFPDLPTPIDTSIVGLDASISVLSSGEEDTTIHYTTAMLNVNGPGVDVEQVTTFYRAQVKSRSWALKADETIQVGDGQRTTFEYDRANSEPISDLPALTVTVTDDPATLEAEFGSLDEIGPGVVVVIGYRESFPADRLSLDRLIGWVGEAPIPDGATVTGATVAMRNRSGLQAMFGLLLDYENTTQPAVLEMASAAVPDSEYQLAAEQGSDDRSLRLTHPLMSGVSLVVFEDGDGASAQFQAFMPLP